MPVKSKSTKKVVPKKNSRKVINKNIKKKNL